MSRFKKVYEKIYLDIFDKTAKNETNRDDEVAYTLKNADAFLFDYSATDLKAITAPKSSYKHRSKERTLNMLAVHNIDRWLRNDYDKHLYRIERDLLLARIFIAKGFMAEGTALLSVNYKTVCKYQHTTYALLYAMELSLRYAMAGRQKQYSAFNRAITAHETILRSEKKSLCAYYKAIALLGQNWNHSPSVINKVKRLHAVVSNEMKLHPWHVNIVCFYRVSIFYFQITEQYEEVIKACKKFEQYLRRNAHLAQDGKFAEIAHYLLHACVVQKKYIRGISYVESYMRYFHKGNFNWIVFMELYFQLLMHSEKYVEAGKVYQEVIASSLFKSATKSRKESWQVFKAYLDFVLWDVKAIKLFRPSRFLNDFDAIKRDRQGLHFELLIIVFIYRMVKKNREELMSFSEFMHSHLKRNMSRRTNFRNYYFAKLLLLLYKYDFNADKAEVIGEKFYDKLKNNYAVRTKDKRIVEVIPYEKLWLLILKLLREKSVQHALAQKNI